MVEYRILIVDDEPHVVEAVAELLESTDAFSTDIYRAYNASEALRMLDEGRMDLVISDIEMPDMNGLKLLEEINLRWPLCRVVFLTAHPNFQYAREALQKHAADYILKTEDDDVLLQRLMNVLGNLEDVLRRPPAPSEEHSASAVQLEHLLIHPEISVRQAGFSENESHFCLLLCSLGRQDKAVRVQAVHELLMHHLQLCAHQLHYAVRENGTVVWLIQLDDQKAMHPISRLFGLLETVQASCLSTFGSSISIVMQPFCLDQHTPAEALRMAELFSSQLEEENMLFCPEHTDLPLDNETDDLMSITIDWLCRYIDEHISGDVSLMKLSSLTGYNTNYLSGIFRQRMGMTLTRYIASRRIEEVRRLLSDQSVSMQEAVGLLGFGSRSYFNRFIKQETGLTPQQLRAQLVTRKHSSK